MSAVALVGRQMRFTNKAFWRNPASAFFTFAFPLMFLVIFTSLLGDDQVDFGPIDLDTTTYYVGAMAAFGVISACFTNIAIQTTFNRDAGILKRLRGTPIPAASYMAARVLHATVVGAILVLVTLLFGRFVYDSPLPTGMPLVEFVVTFLVGSLAFAAMALAVTAVIPNAEAAPPIVNAVILPLLFLSGIFIPLGENAPAWMKVIGNVFPVKHFSEAMRAGFLGNVIVAPPGQGGMAVRAFPFDWWDVAIVSAWGVAGLLLAIRFFSWEPRR
ncbi:MAG TPA: ABC transporter permease [Actinomycetota bacterium]|nr:ABC transporter permease [Actinomycetota bacterium]